MSLGLREDKSCIYTTHVLDILSAVKAGSPSVVGSSRVSRALGAKAMFHAWLEAGELRVPSLSSSAEA